MSKTRSTSTMLALHEEAITREIREETAAELFELFRMGVPLSNDNETRELRTVRDFINYRIQQLGSRRGGQEPHPDHHTLESLLDRIAQLRDDPAIGVDTKAVLNDLIDEFDS